MLASPPRPVHRPAVSVRHAQQPRRSPAVLSEQSLGWVWSASDSSYSDGARATTLSCHPPPLIHNQTHTDHALVEARRSRSTPTYSSVHETASANSVCRPRAAVLHILHSFLPLLPCTMSMTAYCPSKTGDYKYTRRARISLVSCRRRRTCRRCQATTKQVRFTSLISALRACLHLQSPLAPQ